MRISLFGMGYVGAVSAACLTELGHEVVGVDVNQDKVDSINKGHSPVVEDGVAERISQAVEVGRMRATTDAMAAIRDTEVTLVCVGTPSDARGALSLASVEAVFGEIGKAIREKDTEHTVVMRSTVVPGSMEGKLAPLLEEASGRKIGESLALCINPEFLREGTAVADFYGPPFTLVGSVGSGHLGPDVLRKLLAGIDAPFFVTSCRTAEAVKFVSNAFHGLKITFANEVGTLLKELGVDSREAMKLFCEDSQLNISKAYLRPGFAFGGSCLPKELRAFQAVAKARGLEMPMLDKVLPSNETHVERAFELVQKHGRQKIAFFGLAFKPGTDDLRESPLVALAERLLGRGFELSIYDHALEMSKLVGANREFIEREIPHLEKLLAPDPKACLDGAGIIVLGHAPAAAIESIRVEHAGRPIIDLDGVRALEELADAKYEGICW
ncbi:MAG: nucleotide sugar dehydrogenase [Planctomycetota bacterium]